MMRIHSGKRLVGVYYWHWHSTELRLCSDTESWQRTRECVEPMVACDISPATFGWPLGILMNDLLSDFRELAD